MLQPFCRFKKIVLDKLISLKKIYLVSQSYYRGHDHFDDEQRINILLSDYENLGQANMHLNAIKNDRYAAVLDLSKPAHCKKLEDMMDGNEYQLYWAVITSVEDLKKRLDASYKMKLRKFIDEKTNWRIPGGEKVNSHFEITFGELFLILKWRTQKVRLKFEEIERY